MRRFGLLFLAAFLFSLLLAWMPVSAVLASPAAAQAEEAPPAAEAPPVVEKKEIKTYTLPPERYEKAVAYSRARYRLYFVGFAYGLLVLLVVLGGRVAPRFRDWAEGSSRRRFVQAVVYVPLLLLTLAVLGLPTDIYGHWLSLTYEQSVQGWGSWLWDWSKAQLISLVVGVLLVWILYGVIRRSPRRWWFYFWLAALPIIIFLQFISPYVLEPLFFQFEPLEQTQPALVVEIEKVVGRAGLEIPRQRMFEMKASEKYKAVNAYVTGFGGSKRIVVWDTTLEKMTAPQTLLVFGHEMGHYVLGHLYKGIAFFAAVLLLFLCLGYRGLHAVLGRWGEHWAIRGVDDWASLPVLLLLLSVFGFFFSPVANSFSRYLEHQADTYGLEVTHGIVPESAEAAAGAFQVLGEINLADPNPSTFIKVWLYSHPPLNERIVFAQTYDPWGKGEPTQFVPER